MQVFAQPAVPGQTWSSVASDARSGTVAKVDGAIVTETAANACGVGIDSWLTKSTVSISSPDESITSVVQTYVATQYGGLPVEQVQSYTGTAGGVAVRGSITWFFATDPGAPQ